MAQEMVAPVGFFAVPFLFETAWATCRCSSCWQSVPFVRERSRVQFLSAALGSPMNICCNFVGERGFFIPGISELYNACPTPGKCPHSPIGRRHQHEALGSVSSNLTVGTVPT